MTIIAFDGIMALQPHWVSNLLGGWFFMGAWLCALMLQALMMLYARKAAGLAEFISPKQRHDLGKLCFGFTVFWTYLMWSQFLVIWYGNMPEETGFVFARLWGAWRPIGAAVGAGVFVIPFAGLIGVAPKKSPLTLALFATISLCSLWLERYLMVLPSITAEAGPVFGLAGTCADAHLPRTLPGDVRVVCEDLPDGFAATRDDRAGAGGGALAATPASASPATR